MLILNPSSFYLQHVIILYADVRSSDFVGLEQLLGARMFIFERTYTDKQSHEQENRKQLNHAIRQK